MVRSLGRNLLTLFDDPRYDSGGGITMGNRHYPEGVKGFDYHVIPNKGQREGANAEAPDQPEYPIFFFLIH